jgi:hypothetical protein
MTLGKALAAAKASDDGLYGVLLEHGSLKLGYFYGPHGGEAIQ